MPNKKELKESLTGNGENQTTETKDSSLMDVLESMTLAELKSKLLSDYNKKEVPFARKPTNPSKADIISFIITIESLNESTSSNIEIISVPRLEDVIKPVPAREYSKLTRAQKVELKDKLIRVVVRKNGINQTMQISKGHVEFIPWTDSNGQRRLAAVAFNTPWHVPRQVLMSLYQAKSSEFVQQGNSVKEERDVNRLYDIEVLPPLNEAKMSNIADVQRSRKS